MTSPPAPPDPDHAAAPDADGAGDAPAERRLGDPVDERPIPRGCHPLVFGVVMATLQFGCTVYFMRTC